MPQQTNISLCALAQVLHGIALVYCPPFVLHTKSRQTLSNLKTLRTHNFILSRLSRRFKCSRICSIRRPSVTLLRSTVLQVSKQLMVANGCNPRFFESFTFCVIEVLFPVFLLRTNQNLRFEPINEFLYDSYRSAPRVPAGSTPITRLAAVVRNCVLLPMRDPPPPGPLEPPPPEPPPQPRDALPDPRSLPLPPPDQPELTPPPLLTPPPPLLLRSPLHWSRPPENSLFRILLASFELAHLTCVGFTHAAKNGAMGRQTS